MIFIGERIYSENPTKSRKEKRKGKDHLVHHFMDLEIRVADGLRVQGSTLITTLMSLAVNHLPVAIISVQSHICSLFLKASLAV